MNASCSNKVNLKITIRCRLVRVSSDPCDGDRPDFPSRLVRLGNHAGLLYVRNRKIIWIKISLLTSRTVSSLAFLESVYVL